jgi:hypothetical protein
MGGVVAVASVSWIRAAVVLGFHATDLLWECEMVVHGGALEEQN